MHLGSFWIFKDRLTKWVPEKEADESYRAKTQPPQPSVEGRLKRGRAESGRLRKELRRPRSGE